jgi:hypothetical protein
MSEEQIVRDKLREHNFLESTNKPGLFFHQVEEGTVVFCDLRKGGMPKFYGYINKTEEMGKELVDKFTARVKQSLAAIGCASLDEFDNKIPSKRDSKYPDAPIVPGEEYSKPTKAEPSGQHYEKCNSVSWTECHNCGEKICKVCGGKIQ